MSVQDVAVRSSDPLNSNISKILMIHNGLDFWRLIVGWDILRSCQKGLEQSVEDACIFHFFRDSVKLPVRKFEHQGTGTTRVAASMSSESLSNTCTFLQAVLIVTRADDHLRLFRCWQGMQE